MKLPKVHVTISEALGPYTDPVDAVNMLHALLRRMEAKANRAGTTELTASQTADALGLTHDIEVRQLQAMGLTMTRQVGVTMVDLRDYARWTDAMIERVKRRGHRPTPQAQRQGHLL